MELGIGQKLFPSWSAALTLVREHGTDAGGHLTAAIRAGDGSTRLDHAVRALTSFDHAIDNSRKLPVTWFVGGAGKYYRGYEAAKAAVDLLVGSGLIPGAKQRVGLQSLLAARDAFQQSMGVARIDTSRFGRHLAGGWLEATAEDAVSGVRLLAPAAGRDLLAGIAQVQRQVRDGKGVDGQLVDHVARMFDAAGATLSAEIERAAAAGRGSEQLTTDHATFVRSGELLASAKEGLDVLLATAPHPSMLDTYSAA